MLTSDKTLLPIIWQRQLRQNGTYKKQLLAGAVMDNVKTQIRTDRQVDLGCLRD